MIESGQDTKVEPLTLNPGCSIRTEREADMCGPCLLSCDALSLVMDALCHFGILPSKKQNQWAPFDLWIKIL